MTAMPTHDERDIKVLKEMEHIRYRPAMYIGGVDQRALHHMVYEVVAVPIEPALIGLCRNIKIVLYPEQIVISDDTAGMPIERQPENGKPFLELVMTIANGSPFYDGSRKHSEILRVPGSIGVAVANALSSEMTVEVRRNGYLWRQQFRAGVAQGALEQVRPLHDGEGTGNTFAFSPDFTIFEPNAIDYDMIARRCREIAYSVPGLKLTLRDEREMPVREEVFHAPDGLAVLVRTLNTIAVPLHDIIHYRDTIVITPEKQPAYQMRLEFAFQFTRERNIIQYSLVNTVRTTEDGVHVQGVIDGILHILNRPQSRKGKREFRKAAILPGLTLAVAIDHPQPMFESWAQVKLINSDIYSPIKAAVIETFGSYTERETQTFQALLAYLRSRTSTR